MTIGTKLLSVFVGLIIGNLIAQSFHPTLDLGLVLERIWFQGVALFTFWICDTALWKKNS